MPWTRKRTALVAAALAALCGASVPAGAADPAAVPCNGIFVTDAPDDGVYNPTGQFGALTGVGDEQAPDQLEVLNTFVNSVGGKVTMNITIKNLTRDIPDGASATGGNWYYGYWIYQDRIRFVRAANTGDGDIAYKYGYVTNDGDYGGDAANGVYQSDGDTTGHFAEGPNGVVSIVIPPEIGGKNGEVLQALAGTAETIEGQDDFAGFNHQADWAPDGYSLSSPDPAKFPGLTVSECPPAGGTTSPTVTTDPGSVSPGPPASAPPTNAPPATTNATLPFKAAKTLGSAKKGKRKKSLTFKATAGKAISNLRLVLRPAKGGLPVGQATVRSVKAGTSKIRLKVTKKLKAGKYVLVSSGVVDGQTLGNTQAVKVKK